MHGSTLANAHLWTKVESKSHAEASAALQELAARRQHLPRLTDSQAAEIVRLLAAVEQRSGAAHDALPCLLLLMRWAQQVHTASQQQQQAAPAALAALSQAAECACRLLASLKAPADLQQHDLLAACIAYIGGAAHGLSTAQRIECAQQTLKAAQALRASAQDAGIAQFAAGIAALLISLQDEPGVSRDLLASVITLPVTDRRVPPSVSVDALLPLYDMMHDAGRGAEPAPTLDRVPWAPQVWASVLEHLMDAAISEERAGAALGCGGLLAGLATCRSDSPGKAEVMARLQQRLDRLSAQVAHASGPSQAARIELEAAGLAVWLSQQSCGLPLPNRPLLQCQLRALLDGLLSMEGLLDAARRGASPQEASAVLDARLKGRSAQLPGPIGRTLISQCRQFGPEDRAHLRAAVHADAAAAHAGYAEVSATPAAWLQQLDQQPVRQMLDKLFMTYLVLASGVWEMAASGSPEQQVAAVAVLDMLGYLQFCRMRLSTYTTLVQAALGAVSQSAAATRQLLQCLPPLATLTARHPASDQAAWLADAVMASRMQFLMGLLTACAAAAPQEAVEVAVPKALLYLQHPSPSVASAAHGLICAVLQAADPQARGGLAMAYLDRALPAYPATCPPASLALGVDTLARVLPAGSSDAPAVVLRLADRVSQLLQRPGEDAAALELARIVFQLLLVIDVHALGPAMEAVERTVLTAPHKDRSALCADLYAGIRNSDDYVRKPLLARWYQRLAAAVVEHSFSSTEGFRQMASI